MGEDDLTGPAEPDADAGDCGPHVDHRQIWFGTKESAHLISDSQWVFLWLLYLGSDGSSAAVGTSYPAGFTLDPEEAAFWRKEPWGYRLVADSFCGVRVAVVDGQ